jgi:hypothetical protein
LCRRNNAHRETGSVPGSGPKSCWQPGNGNGNGNDNDNDNDNGGRTGLMAWLGDLATGLEDFFLEDPGLQAPGLADDVMFMDAGGLAGPPYTPLSAEHSDAVREATFDLLDYAAGLDDAEDAPQYASHLKWVWKKVTESITHDQLDVAVPRLLREEVVRDWCGEFARARDLPEHLRAVVFHAFLDGGCVDLALWRRVVRRRIQETISYVLARRSLWAIRAELRAAAEAICARYDAFLLALRFVRQLDRLPPELMHMVLDFIDFDMPRADSFDARAWARAGLCSAPDGDPAALRPADCDIECVGSPRLLPAHSGLVDFYFRPGAVASVGVDASSGRPRYRVADRRVRPIHVHIALQRCYAPAPYELPACLVIDQAWMSQQEALVARVLCRW